MDQEQTAKPASGYLYALLALFLLIIDIWAFTQDEMLIQSILAIGLVPVILLLLAGFFIVNPNGSEVLVLLGNYNGTVKANGFFWANPFYKRQAISLRARNFDSERVKVNDKMGNPILISVILVWKVADTFKAAFEVDDYGSFVRVQTDAAVRKLAGMYPYDNFDDDQSEISLRSGLHEVNDALEQELSDRLDIAGIEVLEARIGYLAYAPEIASSMLKRQQAEAIVAARLKIVEGAVGMVEIALEKLSEKAIVDLDDDKKANMVSNLMVVLCGDREANPVINTGAMQQ